VQGQHGEQENTFSFPRGCSAGGILEEFGWSGGMLEEFVREKHYSR